MAKLKKYQTEEERKAAHREASKRYYQRHKEKCLENNAKYQKNNKAKMYGYILKYQQTPKGRALNLVSAHKQEDKKYNRGETTITADWIVENIFSKPCHYCGETDWHELGCDRVDNSLPHTPDNCIPCCCKCNKKKARYSYDDFMKMIGKLAKN